MYKKKKIYIYINTVNSVVLTEKRRPPDLKRVFRKITEF